MNRFKEGIKNADLVAKAVVKRVLKIDENLANKRKEICDPCGHSVDDKVFGGKMCDLCFCPIKNLIYSDKECEAGKWENINS